MTDFTVDSKATPGHDTRWRAGRLGADEAQPITLDISAFTSGTHYNIGGRTDGVIPSGVALAKLASGLYGPFNSTAGSEGDPRRVLAGFLNDDEGVPTKRESGVTSTKSSAALFVIGIVDKSYLPVTGQASTLDDAESTTCVIQYVS